MAALGFWKEKSSVSIWKCLLNSTFPAPSPAGHCIARGWFAALRHSQAGWAAHSPCWRPAWSLQKVSMQDSWEALSLCVCGKGELRGDPVSRAANTLFSPLGFTGSHLLHKIPATKITELTYLIVFAPRITPCPENHKKSPKSSSSSSRDPRLAETVPRNSSPQIRRQPARTSQNIPTSQVWSCERAFFSKGSGSAFPRTDLPRHSTNLPPRITTQGHAAYPRTVQSEPFHAFSEELIRKGSPFPGRPRGCTAGGFLAAAGGNEAYRSLVHGVIGAAERTELRRTSSIAPFKGHLPSKGKLSMKGPPTSINSSVISLPLGLIILKPQPALTLISGSRLETGK